METLLNDTVAWMSGLPPAWVYLTVFAVAFTENVVPPIPGDMLVVFGGYLVGLGVVGFLPTAALATAGGVLGFMTMYAIGWRVGDAIEDPDRLRWIPTAAAERVRRWTLRYGYGVVAANRFLSGARSVISLTVGAAQMDPARTALWATVSAALWCSLLVYLGYVVGDNWAVIGDYLRLYGQWVTGALVVGGGGYVAWGVWKRRGARRSSEDPSGRISGTRER